MTLFDTFCCVLTPPCGARTKVSWGGTSTPDTGKCRVLPPSPAPGTCRRTCDLKVREVAAEFSCQRAVGFSPNPEGTDETDYGASWGQSSTRAARRKGY